MLCGVLLVGIKKEGQIILKVKSKIFRRKAGRNKGAWIVRLQYEDETGKTRYLERHAEGKGAAGDLKERLIDEVKKRTVTFARARK